MKPINGKFSSDPDFITKTELARRLSLSSRRIIDRLVKRRLLSCYKLGWRTMRFSWRKAQEELARLELKALVLK